MELAKPATILSIAKISATYPIHLPSCFVDTVTVVVVAFGIAITAIYTFANLPSSYFHMDIVQNFDG